MKILVLNCGSSSLKSQVFETSPEQIAATQDRVLAKAVVERIGTRDAIVSITADGRRTRVTRPVANIDVALKSVIEAFSPFGPIEAVASIEIGDAGEEPGHPRYKLGYYRW